MQRTVSILLLILSSGCHAWHRNHPVRYQTIGAHPHRQPEVARSLNERALQQHDPIESEEILQRALVADVEFGPAHCNLGRLYFSQGKYYLAAWEFDYAAKLMPHRPEPLNNLGLVHEQIGRVEESLAYYQQAMEIEPTNSEFIGNLARAKIKLNEHDEHLQSLLRDLLMYATRPIWRAWAEEQFHAVQLKHQSNHAEETMLEDEDPHTDREGDREDRSSPVSQDLTPTSKATHTFGPELLPTPAAPLNARENGRFEILPQEVLPARH